MKLIASLLVRNEIGRYLPHCLEALLEFVDEVRVLDDGSDDGSGEMLEEFARAVPGVVVLRDPASGFFEHEGRTRNRLLDWTLAGEPTHVLAIDADEFVADSALLRAALEREPHAEVFTLCMEEVWKAAPDGYHVRCDGGWCPHEVPSLYRVPARRGADFRIQDRALACGREPMRIRARARAAAYTDTALLHFGWTRQSERVARHARYAIADGGRFHASAHLDSILWPDERVTLEPRPAPPLPIYAELAAWATSADPGEG